MRRWNCWSTASSSPRARSSWWTATSPSASPRSIRGPRGSEAWPSIVRGFPSQRMRWEGNPRTILGQASDPRGPRIDLGDAEGEVAVHHDDLALGDELAVDQQFHRRIGAPVQFEDGTGGEFQ